jgi:hypothetical protein
VHFARGLDEHVGEGRMQIRSGDELDGRRDQGERVRRNVLRKIDRARREIDLAQVAEAPHVTVALVEIEETDGGPPAGW